MRFRRLVESEAAEAAYRSAVSMGRRERDDEAVDRWRERIASGAVWGLEVDGAVIGQCKLLPTGHWFGGRVVDCLDVAGVAVAPEHRGQGAAREMMRAAVEMGRADGYGLSLLFPATTELYRKLGWELAGTWTRYSGPPRSVPADGPRMRRADRLTDWDAVRECSAQAAKTMSGPAVRSEARWRELADVEYRYVLDHADAPGRVQSYALVAVRQRERDWQHTVAIEDWAAVTPDGLRAVLGLVGRWRSFGRAATFIDGFPSAWAALLPEQDFEAKHLHWMARGLHLANAVASRGFPPGLALAVTFRVEDDEGLLGPQRLEIAGGRGQLSDAAGADVRLAGRAVGPLFTGFWSARQLQAMGLLHGPEEALDLLDAAFAGPPPMLRDFF